MNPWEMDWSGGQQQQAAPAAPWEMDWGVTQDLPATEGGPTNSVSLSMGEPPVPRERPAPPEPPGALATAGRKLMIGTQGVARGLGDLVGAPVDLTTAAINAGIYGVNRVMDGGRWAVEKATGAQLPEGEIPYITNPVGGSNSIADTVADAVEATGVPLVDERDMTPAERTAYTVNRFGANAVASGAGLTRAAASRATAAGPRAPAAGDALLAPYEQAGPTMSARPYVGDVAGGAGSGAAVSAYEHYVPEENQGPIGAMVAGLVGGVGGSTAATVAQSPRAVVNAAVDALPDRNVPLDPKTGAPTSRGTADKAARYLQSQVENPGQEANTIRERADYFRDNDMPVPTTDLLADDPGMRGVVTRERLSDSAPFVRQDQRVRTAAAEEVRKLAPEGGDFARTQQAAQGRVDMTREAAQRQVDQAAGQARGVDMARDAEGGRLAAQRGTADAASEALDRNVRDTTAKVDQNASKMFRDIDPNGTVQVDAEPMAELVKEIRAGVPKLVPAGEVLPTAWLDRFDEAAKAGTISFAELNEARPFLSDAIRAAEKSDPLLRRNLLTLKGFLDDAAERLAGEGNEAGQRAQAAVTNFRENVAPAYREGTGGKFRDAVRKDQFGTSTQPTNTARRFLSSKEAATDFARIMRDSDAPDAGMKAARQYLLDSASRAVGADGKVNPNLIRRWRDQNKSVIDQVPGFRAEVDALVRDAVNGKFKAGALAQELKAAQVKQGATEREIQRSALSIVLDNSPENAVAKVVGAANPAKAMDEVMRAIGSDQAAREGWKKAFGDYVEKQVTNTNRAMTDDQGRPVSLAKIENADQIERLMGKLYTPEEMNAWQRAKKATEAFGRLSVRATAGSPTKEYEGLAKTTELVLKSLYGNLEGGGEMRRLRLAASTVPWFNDQAKITRLMNRLAFDPELAAHLLTREPRVIGTPAWNAKLNRLMAYETAAREGADEGRDDE